MLLTEVTIRSDASKKDPDPPFLDGKIWSVHRDVPGMRNLFRSRTPDSINAPAADRVCQQQLSPRYSGEEPRRGDLGAPPPREPNVGSLYTKIPPVHRRRGVGMLSGRQLEKHCL